MTAVTNFWAYLFFDEQLYNERNMADGQSMDDDDWGDGNNNSNFDLFDRITIASDGNIITTGSGADTITVTSGNNIIHAGDGANTITATSGVNAITTDSGNDIRTDSPMRDGAFFASYARKLVMV